jgi:hypothetical protein
MGQALSTWDDVIAHWLLRPEQQAYYIYVEQERQLYAHINAESHVLQAYWRARDAGAATPLMRQEAARSQDRIDQLYAQVRILRARIDALDEIALRRMQTEQHSISAQVQVGAGAQRQP